VTQKFTESRRFLHKGSNLRSARPRINPERLTNESQIRYLQRIAEMKDRDWIAKLKIAASNSSSFASQSLPATDSVKSRKRSISTILSDSEYSVVSDPWDRLTSLFEGSHHDSIECEKPYEPEKRRKTGSNSYLSISTGQPATDSLMSDGP
jgi:hypothetical protein